MNRILKTIFTIVARSGISMPHDGKTPDLLLCGAKPTGWLEWNEIDQRQQLEDAVRKGTLLKADVAVTRNYHLYQRHSTQADVNQINEMTCRSPIFGLPLSETQQATYKNNAWNEDDLIRGVTSGIVDTVVLFSNLVTHGVSNKLVFLLNNLTEQGEFSFSYHKIHQTEPLTIYGQINQQDNMKMLAEELQKNFENPGYIEDRALLGRLLGYSDNDIVLSYANSGFIVRKTENMRRCIRQYLMMQEGPNWPRNP